MTHPQANIKEVKITLPHTFTQEYCSLETWHTITTWVPPPPSLQNTGVKECMIRCASWFLLQCAKAPEADWFPQLKIPLYDQIHILIIWSQIAAKPLTPIDKISNSLTNILPGAHDTSETLQGLDSGPLYSSHQAWLPAGRWPVGWNGILPSTWLNIQTVSK